MKRQHADRCLGERAAALADGELGPEARDAALSHLVNCDGCRDEVAGQRRLKARLGELTEPLPPAGLLDRLTAMGALGAPELSLGPDTWHGDPVPPRHRVHLLSARARRGRAGRVDSVGHLRPYGRRVVRYAMAGGVSVLALGVSAFALGGQGAQPVVPAGDSFSIEHARTTTEIPFGVVEPNAQFRAVLVSARP